MNTSVVLPKSLKLRSLAFVTFYVMHGDRYVLNADSGPLAKTAIFDTQ